MTKVTLITPVYNGMPFLKETVESNLNQDYGDYIYLCVDDGSQDGSLEYLQSIDDPRLKVISKQNQGLCQTMNYAFSLVETPYVARCDQDDISKPNRLSRQIAVIQESGADILFTNLEKFSDRGTAWSNTEKQPAKEGALENFDPWSHGCLLQSSLLGKTEVFRSLGYRPEFYPVDDWDLELRAHQAGYDIRVMGEALVKYRFHAGANTLRLFSRTEDLRRWAEECFERRAKNQDEGTFEQYKAYKKASPLKDRFRWWRKDLHKKSYRLGGGSYLNKEYIKASGYLMVAALTAPLLSLKKVVRYLEGRSKVKG